MKRIFPPICRNENTVLSLHPKIMKELAHQGGHVDQNDSVAQLVEQVTLNHWVVSSSLTGVTIEASFDLRIGARFSFGFVYYIIGVGLFSRRVFFSFAVRFEDFFSQDLVE